MKTKFTAFALLSGLGLLHFPVIAAAQPVATTLAATSISQTNATINGTVNPNGAVAVAYFQYGLTTNYGNIGGFIALPATNTAQTLAGLVVNALTGAAGANWTRASAPLVPYLAFSSSADGTRLAAGANNGGIYASTNSGSTWTLTSAPTEVWTSIASSADGTRLAATIGQSSSGLIYISTNSGATWTLSGAPFASWISIASSANGARLAAVAKNDGVYTSTNGGVNWTKTSATNANWFSIASSVDGTRLAAAADRIYTSTNGGATWTQTSATNGQWQCIASSADGLKLAAADDNIGIGIYVSTNGGITWTGTSAPNLGWQSIASSADGTRLAAVTPAFGTMMNGAVYTSTDSGLTWTGPSGDPNAVWASIAMSADGSKMAGAGNGTLYTSTGTASPLTPGTTYHYRAVGLNSLGTGLGSDLTFTTLAPPTVTTSPATSITSTNATLNGTVNPNGAATTAYFRYGLTASYGSFGVTNNLPATNGILSVSNLIGSLSPGTTYHFQLVASNSLGTATGADFTLTTLAQPSVTTLSATSITTTNAIINGTVNPNLAATSAYFRYGLTTNYGSFSATNALPATNVTLSVSSLISNLTPGGTTYHFQLVASNSVGVTTGSDLTFTTLAIPPAVATLAASGTTSTNTTLNGTVNPNGAATTAYFRYGLTTNYGSFSATNTLAATNVTLAVSSLIASLAPDTTYHFQLVAGNSAGPSQGNDLAFTTGAGAPVVTNLAATGITATNATLNGAVNPNGASTLAYFRYGLTTTYGSFSATNSLAATNATLSVSNLISGLTPGTSYHFQLVAGNSVATSLGNDLAFVTLPSPAVAATLSATGVTSTNATLNGTVDPNGAATSAYFQLGVTTNYGDVARLTALPATNSTLNVAASQGGVLGTNWTQTGAPTADWYAIASSADGTRLASGVNNGGIYTSTNSGATWTLTSAPVGMVWIAIVCSSDGTRLAAVASGGGIYTSTNSGGTWTPTSAPSGFWNYIASSADGTRLAAVLDQGGIYTSTNGGATWTLTSAPVEQWTSIASSSDGTRLAAGVNGGGIYTSTNSGVTWTLTSAPSQVWIRIASSADGAKLAAAVFQGNIYTSTNGGSSWTLTSAPSANWNAIVSSADGTRLAAAVSGAIYASTNGGATWTLTSAPNLDWISLACSADGQQLAADAYGTGIFISSGTPWLTPGTTYHYRLVAANSLGTSLGSDVSFTTAIVPPTVTTLSASGLTLTNAALNGSVNPNGAATVAYFRYGLTTNYGSFSVTNALAATNAAVAVSNLVASLTPGTTYHFMLVASNSAGITAGSDLTFTTLVSSPTVATLAASGVTSTNAMLNGTVSPNGAAAAAYFQYGLTTNYGSFSATNSVAATNATLSVSNLISGLATGTTYHFQLVASNSVGTNSGADLTFTTGATAPAVSTLAASGVTATNAMLNGTVNPNGAATTVYFQYGLTASYGGYSTTNSLAATNVALSVSNLISGLTPNTTWHFRLVASNGAGTNAGNDLTFTTLASSPAVATLAASGVTSTNATLNGTVNPNGAATSAYFRYGLTTSYGSYTATNALAATNAALSVSNLVGMLTPGTTYHFQLVAGNSIGTNAGADLTLTTTAAVPVATTLAATSVTSTNARLNGAVNPNGAATSAYFRYGLTTNYGSYSATNSLAATNVVLSVSNLVASLTAGTTYHFQLVAGNSVGTNAGADLTFTTSPAIPAATTLAATSVTPTNAILNGTVNPNGAATSAYFRYGLTTSYGSYTVTNSLAATNVTLSVSNLVGSLTPGTTYHFMLVASNSVGTKAGADQMFTTTVSRALPFSLTGATRLADGTFQFSFTNLNGLSFTILDATNVSLPLSNWTVLGTATEAPPGQYQFTDPQATNSATRFYRVRSP